MEIKSKIESDTAIYELVDDLMHMKVKPGVTIDIDAARLGVKNRKSIQGDTKVRMLLDMTAIFHVTNEARAYAAKKEIAEMNRAMAIYVEKSLPSSIIANFYLKINRPRVPTKVFKSKKSALKWLEKFIPAT